MLEPFGPKLWFWTWDLDQAEHFARRIGHELNETNSDWIVQFLAKLHNSVYFGAYCFLGHQLIMLIIYNLIMCLIPSWFCENLQNRTKESSYCTLAVKDCCENRFFRWIFQFSISNNQEVWTLLISWKTRLKSFKSHCSCKSILQKKKN